VTTAITSAIVASQPVHSGRHEALFVTMYDDLLG
jgi:hypothetical protein